MLSSLTYYWLNAVIIIYGKFSIGRTILTYHNERKVLFVIDARLNGPTNPKYRRDSLLNIVILKLLEINKYDRNNFLILKNIAKVTGCMCLNT